MSNTAHREEFHPNLKGWKTVVLRVSWIYLGEEVLGGMSLHSDG